MKNINNINKAYLIIEDSNQTIELITYSGVEGLKEFYLEIKNEFYYRIEKYLNLKEIFTNTGSIKNIKKDFLILNKKELFRLYGCIIVSIGFNADYFEIKILPDYITIDDSKMLFTQINRDKKINELLYGI